MKAENSMSVLASSSFPGSNSENWSFEKKSSCGNEDAFTGCANSLKLSENPLQGRVYEDDMSKENELDMNGSLPSAHKSSKDECSRGVTGELQ